MAINLVFSACMEYDSIYYGVTLVLMRRLETTQKATKCGTFWYSSSWFIYEP